MKRLFFVLGLIALATSGFATSWSALADFNPVSNTESDIWQYGYTDTANGVPFTLFTGKVDWLTFGVPVGAVDGWDPGGNSLASFWGYPSWVRNLTGSTIAFGGGQLYTDGLYCWPYFGGRAGVIRWKAPEAGTYDVSAMWKAAAGDHSAPVGIYAPTSSVSWTTTFVGGDGEALGHSISNITLAAGDYIYFEAGQGTGNANLVFDATVSTVVPEPGCMISLVCGVAGLGLLRRRR